MEFFYCTCPESGDVLLDGSNQGPNKDSAGNFLTKQCNRGLHFVALQCSNSKNCIPRLVEIKDTDPILPMEVSFQCEN